MGMFGLLLFARRCTAGQGKRWTDGGKTSENSSWKHTLKGNEKRIYEGREIGHGHGYGYVDGLGSGYWDIKSTMHIWRSIFVKPQSPCAQVRSPSQFLLFPYFLQLVYTEFMRYSSLSPSSSSPVLLALGTVNLSRPFSLLNNLHPYCAVSVSPIRVDLLCCTSHSSLYLLFLCYVTLLKSYNIWFECNMLFSIFFDSIRW